MMNMRTNHRPVFVRLLLSTITAVSLPVLLMMALWDFELRSLQKLILQGAVFAPVLFVLSYYWVFRNIHQPPPWRPHLLFFSGVLVFLFGFLVVPQHPSFGRSMAAFVLTGLSSFGIAITLYSWLISQKNDSSVRLLLILTMLGGMVGIGILLFNSVSVRMYGDDFCYAMRPKSQGYFGAVLNFYTGWSGRFFSNFLVMALSGWRWATFAQLIAIAGATFWAVRGMVKGSNGFQILAALAASFWISLTIFSVIPDLYKSLYWIVSSVVVLPIMILAPCYVLVAVLFLRSNSHRGYWAILAISLLSFMIATTHEAAVLGWLTAQGIVLAWAGLFARKNKKRIVLLVAGSLSTLVGLMVILLSPGTVLRGEVQGYTRTTSIWGIISNTAIYAVQFLRSITAAGWLMLFTTLGLGWVLQTGVPRNLKVALIMPLLTFVVVATCFVPGVYAMSNMIPLRTQLIPGAYLVYGTFLMGLLLPHPTSKLLAVSVYAVLLIVLPVAALQNVRRISPTILPMQNFARDWDMRDQLARQRPVEIEAISIPWDQWEQELVCTRNYYRSLWTDATNR